MGTKDKRIDTYISKSADFAKPILIHLRKLVHQECPDVNETMKWSFPHFDYKGMMCAMAAFKQHCAFGFWKAKLMADYEKTLYPNGETAMGHFGQIKSLKDLPGEKILVKYIREAMRLNDEGIKVKRKPRPKIKEKLVMPPDMKKALNADKKAIKHFEAFSYSQKKDYIQWITEAKAEETRHRRLETAIEWIGEGKSRNWKYERK
jgi:uncharacterized protein YdeI (YjbR/CyaY-like superfamily)